VKVAAPTNKVFDRLAGPANLSKYVAMMTMAVPKDAETLHVAAEVQGRHEGDAHFHVDRTRHRLPWGGEGEGQYGGWLQAAEAEGGSTVTVHIQIAEQHDRDANNTVINRAFNETMHRVRQLAEGDS